MKQEIGETVADDEQNGGEENRRGHEIDVATENRGQQERPEPGPAQDDLDQQRGAQQRGDGETEESDQWVRGRRERVAEEQSPTVDAPRPGGADVGLGEHFFETRVYLPCEGWSQSQDDRQDRQYQAMACSWIGRAIIEERVDDLVRTFRFALNKASKQLPLELNHVSP